MIIQRKQIYNPESIETANDRRIFGGFPTSLFDLNRIRYEWAYKLWKTMLNNTWFPEEVNMNADKNCYHNELTSQERNSYDKALAQLIFMDSIQTNNLIDNINPYVTAPEINLVLVRQAFEEALHSQSYAVMVDSIAADADAIYEMWRHDQTLKSKNDKIADDYITLSNQVDEKAMVKAMYANQILEGIYFYTGFAYFYTLAINGKMLNSSTMIKFIHRDEVTHLLIFQNMINTLRTERPDLFTPALQEEVIEMFRKATELEISWGLYITNGDILGLSTEAITKYVHYLCDTRLRAVKLPLLYNQRENPLPALKNYSIFNNQRTNFFEGKVTNYAKGALDMNDF